MWVLVVPADPLLDPTLEPELRDASAPTSVEGFCCDLEVVLVLLLLLLELEPAPKKEGVEAWMLNLQQGLDTHIGKSILHAGA